MAGTAKQLIDLIIAQRAKGNPAVAQAIRAKLVLKGINPDNYTITTPDEPSVIERLETVAKELGVKGISVRSRLLLLVGLFLLGMIALLLLDLQFNHSATKRVIFPSFEKQLIDNYKNSLKTVVDAEAASLADKLKSVKGRDEQVNLMIAETDPIRFFDDNSGYFFTYDLNGVRVNVPIDKSQNGQNLLLLVDANGKRLIEEIVNAAKRGSGFVEYYFKGEDKNVHPKLSYVKSIPGTNFLVGAGVYLDNVAKERNSLENRIDESTSIYLTYKIVTFILIIGLMVGAYFVLSRSIITSIGPIARL